jgi:hypothetical protein
MRIVRALIPALGLALVLQGVVAVVPHDHDCDASRSGDALVAASVIDVHHDCLACSTHVPAAVAAASTSALDSVDIRPVTARAEDRDALRSETGVFDPRGPPQVV